MVQRELKQFNQLRMDPTRKMYPAELHISSVSFPSPAQKGGGTKPFAQHFASQCPESPCSRRRKRDDSGRPWNGTLKWHSKTNSTSRSHAAQSVDAFWLCLPAAGTSHHNRFLRLRVWMQTELCPRNPEGQTWKSLRFYHASWSSSDSPRLPSG